MGNRIFIFIFPVCLWLASCGGSNSSADDINFLNQNPGAGQSKSVKEKEVLNGEVERFYKSGSIKSRVNYNYGVKHGKATNYYEKGGVHSEFTYVNGVQQGTTKWYYTSGKIFQEIPYVDGQIDGMMKQYNRSGKLNYDMPHKLGNPSIKAVEYDSKGNVIKYNPKLEIKQGKSEITDDNIALTVRLADPEANVETYFYGNLISGEYIGGYSMREAISVDNVGTFEVNIPKNQPGTYVVDVVAKVKRPNSGYVYFHREYNIKK